MRISKKVCQWEMIFSKLKFTSDENITQNTIDRINQRIIIGLHTYNNVSS